MMSGGQPGGQMAGGAPMHGAGGAGGSSGGAGGPQGFAAFQAQAAMMQRMAMGPQVRLWAGAGCIWVCGGWGYQQAFGARFSWVSKPMAWEHRHGPSCSRRDLRQQRATLAGPSLPCLMRTLTWLPQTPT